MLRSVFLTALLVLESNVASSAQLADPCGPESNSIVCENSKPGNPPSDWDINGAGDPTVQGFATDISVDQGSTIRFKVDTNSTNYRLDIYRLGYYGGLGARRIVTVQPSVSLPQVQPPCITDSITWLTNCDTWNESAAWNVPLNATSGIYVAKLVREDGIPGTNHIVFVVRDDDGDSRLLLQTSDSTWHAYNRFGQNSLYVESKSKRAYKFAYKRPFRTRECCAERWVFNAEYPVIRWLEANGYDISYSTNVDSARFPGKLLKHRAILSVGYDDYWSGDQLNSVALARAAGVYLAFPFYKKGNHEFPGTFSGMPQEVSMVVIGDNERPTVSLVRPRDGIVVSGSITLLANATDDIGIAGVRFLVDGEYLGTEDEIRPYTTSWNTSTVPDGPYVLSALVRDFSGNTALSSITVVDVSNGQPTESATTPSPVPR